MFMFFFAIVSSHGHFHSYLLAVGLPFTLDHTCILSRLIFEISNRNAEHQGGGGGGNTVYSPLLVREICIRSGSRDGEKRWTSRE